MTPDSRVVGLTPRVPFTTDRGWQKGPFRWAWTKTALDARAITGTPTRGTGSRALTRLTGVLDENREVLETPGLGGVSGASRGVCGRTFFSPKPLGSCPKPRFPKPPRFSSNTPVRVDSGLDVIFTCFCPAKGKSPIRE